MKLLLPLLALVSVIVAAPTHKAFSSQHETFPPPVPSNVDCKHPPAAQEDALPAALCLLHKRSTVDASLKSLRGQLLRSIRRSSTPLVNHLWAAALIALRDNQPKAALRQWDALLKVQPSHRMALYHRAVTLLHLQRPQEANRDLNRALEVNPREPFPPAAFALGNMALRQGRYDDAMVYFQQLVQLDGKHVHAWANLALIYLQQNDLNAALHAYQRILAVEERNALAVFGVANVLWHQGKQGQSAQQHTHFVELVKAGAFDKENEKAAVGSALVTSGHAFYVRGDIAGAKEAWIAALEHNPHAAHAATNLGVIYANEGDYPRASKMLQRANRLQPNDESILFNWALVLKRLGRHDEAARHLTHLTRSVNPQSYKAFIELGGALQLLDKHQQAIQEYERGLAIEPDSPEGFATYYHCVQSVCDWRNKTANLATLRRHLSEQVAQGKRPALEPAASIAFELTLREQLQVARGYAQEAIRRTRQGMDERERAALDQGRPQDILQGKDLPGLGLTQDGPVHIGYVSHDFRQHQVGFLMANAFGYHRRPRVRVSCFATSPDDRSEYRRSIASKCDEFVDISHLDTRSMAVAIRTRRVDVLIDLTGHMFGSRLDLFVWRPAPIQITYPWHCGPVGAPEFMDYMIADDIVIPKSLRVPEHYPEKLLMMPHTYYMGDHKQGHRGVLGHATDHKLRMLAREVLKLMLPIEETGIDSFDDPPFVFCTFNKLYKLDPATWATWMRILKRVPNSMLMLLKAPSDAEAHLRREAAAHGVPDYRLVFHPTVHIKEYFVRISQCDLALDTPLYNSHTVAMDTLWAGTPLLTMPDAQRMAGRVAASILHAFGMEKQLVVHTPQEYEDRAVELAADGVQGKQITALRKQVRDLREHAPLFDTRQWVHDLEDRLVGLVREHGGLQGQGNKDEL